ncbi:V-type ATPase subunit [Enterococcus sp. AZ109]|uniref:V-type ATPase subunit n=1 Tax=Enterococcus sp. AZ109 TaxID=2774634 RepID=UPI003F22F35F
MSLSGYHVLNPLIRAKELELLDSELVEKLIQAKDIEEVGELLQTTCYAPLLQPSVEDTFNERMDQEQTNLFNWLVEIAPEKEVVWVYTMRFTFHNLKVLTKGEYLEQSFDHLFVPDGFYSIQQLKEVIRTGESEQLPVEIVASVQEVLEYLEESTVLQGIDVIYDRHFLQTQRLVGERLAYPELLNEIIHFIDLTNIILLVRGLYQRRSHGFMDSVLSSAGAIAKETLLEFVGGELASFKEFLRNSVYRDELSAILQEEILDPALLERFKDNYLTGLYQTAQTQAFGPLPLLAFLNAKEVERKNLQLIVTAKRSKIAKERIRKRVRNVYGL